MRNWLSYSNLLRYSGFGSYFGKGTLFSVYCRLSIGSLTCLSLSIGCDHMVYPSFYQVIMALTPKMFAHGHLLS